MVKLSVNLNKIALIRNSREGNYPNVVEHGKTCLNAGADGLTVHPRPDQRHIRPDDVYALSALIAEHNLSQQSATDTQHESSKIKKLAPLEYNIEGNPFAPAQGSYPGLLALTRDTRPDQCTLVPDGNDQLTSDHGFDLKHSGEVLKPLIEQLHEWGIRVSLFMDPEPEQLDLAHTIGADRIEFYTGPYAAVEKNRPQDQQSADTLFARYMKAAQHAVDLGLGVNAGHDLNLENLEKLSSLPGLQEVSIGHALIVDALAMGLEQAVISYKTLLTQ